jgi:hypothetical protein
MDLIQATIEPGTDLIYRIGQPPPTLRMPGAAGAARAAP